MPVQLSELEPREVDGHVHYFRKEDGKQVCGSKRRKKPPEERCAVSTALHANGRCRLHGGLDTVGAPLKHGRYSEKLGPLREAFEDYQKSPHLRDLDPTIALLWSWSEQLMVLAEEKDGPDFRDMAVQLCALLAPFVSDGAAAMDRADGAAFKQAFAALKDHLTNGADVLRTRQQAIREAERASHRTEEALKIELKGEQIVTARAVLALLQEVIQVILQIAPNEIADRIVRRIRETVVGRSAGFAGAGLDGSRN